MALERLAPCVVNEALGTIRSTESGFQAPWENARTTKIRAGEAADRMM